MTRKTCPECKLKKGHRISCDVWRIDSELDAGWIRAAKQRIEESRNSIREDQAIIKRLKARIDWRAKEGR